MNSDISKAIAILKQGGVVIFPTDTAFALSCRVDNEKAIERLFTIKQRNPHQAVPVLVESIDMVRQYTTNISDNILSLMKLYWPGALTIIIRIIIAKIPQLIRGDGDTVGFRIPNSPTSLEIIKGVGIPLVGTSANFHGKPTPYAFDQLDPELVSLVDLVVPGECPVRQASTVIDCSVTPWKIIRQGAVSLTT